MFTVPICHLGNEDGFLDSIIDSVCCDLDATIAASYGGSGQTWANIIALPADGSAQTDYDFHLGADSSSSTDDPAFVGPVGDKAAHWAPDGTDLFSLKALTDLVKNMHKTTGASDWWMAAAFQYPAGEVGFEILFGTTTSVASEGVSGFVNEGSSNGVRVNFDRGNSRSNNDFNTGAAVAGADHLLIVSYQESTDDITAWLNSTTGITDTDASTGTSTTDPTDTLGLMARGGDGSFNMTNGSRYYHFSLGNEFLDDTKAALIFTHLGDRRGVDYTA